MTAVPRGPVLTEVQDFVLELVIGPVVVDIDIDGFEVEIDGVVVVVVVEDFDREEKDVEVDGVYKQLLGTAVTPPGIVCVPVI